MRKKQRADMAWVVYKMYLAGAQGPNAVCEQSEWDEMERLSPGRHTLVQAGIGNEAEAERLARAAPGGTTPGKSFLRARK